MREIALHILDIVQNSIRACATRIKIKVVEDLINDQLYFEICDNGIGMNQEMINNVTDPFYTTRTTRRVGLGIPLLKSTAQACQGDLSIEANLGAGVCIKALFMHSHIDRPPLGDMATTMLALILGSGHIDFVYEHYLNGQNFSFSTKEMQEVLGEISFQNPEVMIWLKEFLEEGEKVLSSKEEGLA